MECVLEARALKSSFLSNNHQVYCNDDVWCLTGVNAGVNGGGGDGDFAVEELLNLEEDGEQYCFSHEDEEEEASQKGSETSENNASNSAFSGFADDFDSLSAGDLAGELAVPQVDDLENLEWLSQFVDDSTSGFTPLFPAATFAAKSATIPASRPVFPVPVPRKSRSKRSRSTGIRRWSSGDSSSTPSSSYGSSSAVADVDWFSGDEKPAAKKQRRRKSESEGGGSPASGRRCTHCQVQKTPQWRTGPDGPKTLCNACGVRFKSGRLFPEYRPAFSPTFSQAIHSNSHRKVLEIRRKKEVEPVAVAEPAGFGSS